LSRLYDEILLPPAKVLGYEVRVLLDGRDMPFHKVGGGNIVSSFEDYMQMSRYEFVKDPIQFVFLKHIKSGSESYDIMRMVKFNPLDTSRPIELQGIGATRDGRYLGPQKIDLENPRQSLEDTLRLYEKPVKNSEDIN
jgi:hypothetical protein